MQVNTQRDLILFRLKWSHAKAAPGENFSSEIYLGLRGKWIHARTSQAENPQWIWTNQGPTRIDRQLQAGVAFIQKTTWRLLSRLFYQNRRVFLHRKQSKEQN